MTTTHVSGLRKSSTSRFSTTGGRWLCFPFILLIMLVMISDHAYYDHADYDDSGRDHADYNHSGSDHAEHDVVVAITLIIKTNPMVEKIFSKK